MGALVMTRVEAVEGDYVLRIPLSPVKHLDEQGKTGLSYVSQSLTCQSKQSSSYNLNSVVYRPKICSLIQKINI